MKNPEPLIKTPEKRIRTFRILYWQEVNYILGRISGELYFRGFWSKLPTKTARLI
jgi:hypothetical protein